jgi:hypothetical protein
MKMGENPRMRLQAGVRPLKGILLPLCVTGIPVHLVTNGLTSEVTMKTLPPAIFAISQLNHPQEFGEHAIDDAKTALHQ